ncbi:MAG: transcriptional repressor [Muribaculaceae bacterium]|nr:transcriptional repressor [Muribaculaceae bacterium]MDE6866085.1 transcriptional repressor [Muribaculaceae bacterium]
MADEEIIEKMNRLGVRPTAVRIMVGRLLLTADHPLSGLEIEQVLDTVDRSTITRSLSLFTEKGIVHVIDDGSGAAKYEWCDSHDEGDSDRHIHFHCVKCGRTFCLHSNPIPDIPLPEGFLAESANFTISGKCDKCTSHFLKV